MSVLIELLRDPEVSRAYREKLITARPELIRSVFQRAAARGELSADKIVLPLFRRLVRTEACYSQPQF